MQLTNLHSHLNKLKKDLNLDGIQIVPLETPLSLEFYKAWIDRDYFGEMTYLKEHLPKKETPRLHWNLAESSIVVTKSYVPHPNPLESRTLDSSYSGLQIARYAEGEDYHFWFKNELRMIADSLKKQFPNLELMPMTDSSPVLERDLAVKAGLGWIGKNTCLIHPQRGSFSFIGEIYTNLKIQNESPISPMQDFCGKCTKCIDSCPTQAILEPRVLDARKCISYWTIESRKTPPPELAEKFGNWFFGCDVCQNVCPWNNKILKNFATEQSENINSLRFILKASGKTLEKKFQKTPLWRARAFGLKRNAIIVAANGKHKELLEDIMPYKEDKRLSTLAHWAEKKLIEA